MNKATLSVLFMSGEI